MVREPVFAVALVLAAAQAPGSGAPASAPPYESLVEQALSEYIAPAAGDLAASTSTLALEVRDRCAAPTEADFAGLDIHLEVVARDIAGLFFLQLDPLLVEGRRERLLFWPDPRGVTIRQVEEVLAEADETAATAETLADKSVALQGLGALDYLLHGSGAETLWNGDPAGDFRCRYAVAAGERIAATADELAAELGEDGAFAALMRTPGRANPAYDAPAAAAEDLVLSALTGIELVRDSLLSPVLGDGPETARPRLAPLWRSGLALPFAEAMLIGSADLLLDGGIVDLLAENDRWIADQIASERTALAAAFPPAGTPIGAAATDPEVWRMLSLVSLIADNLKVLVGQYLPEAVGLNLGFNALDGD